jgi:SPP1 family predicted phage head-tail adaptor
MLAGKLDQRVTLLSYSATVGDGGDKTETWPEIGKAWANIKPTTRGIVVRGDKIEYPISYEITVPYSSKYLSARRITHRDVTYSVRGFVNPDFKFKDLVFICESGTAK